MRFGILAAAMMVTAGCSVESRQGGLIEPTYSYLRDEPMVRPIDAGAASRFERRLPDGGDVTY
jgi:hypothetical protein